MRIETSRFGLIEIDDERILDFPWGIPGFESIKRFVMIEHRTGPFHWLQAVDDPDVAFVVCPSEELGYRYIVPPAKAKTLDIERNEDLLVLVLVSLDRGKNKVRPHMSAPLLMNSATRKGFQWVLEAGELKKHIELFNIDDLLAEIEEEPA